MKTVKEVLNFCIQFILYDPYKIDQVIELKYIRDYDSLCETDFNYDDSRIKVLSIIDVVSLKVLDRDVKSFNHEISNLRVAILQLLRSGRFYREEKDNEKSSNPLFDGKELIRDNQQEGFQSKKWFN